MKHKNLSIPAAILSVFSFLYPIMLRFWGSNMLQRGDYAREICYFVVVDASPFPLQPVCIIYFSFPAYYAGLSWRHRIFHLPHSQ